MITPYDMTLYSRSISANAEVFTRSVIYGVAWEDRRAANARLNGNLKADDIAVYIPLSRNVSIKAGDVIVRGVVADTISSAFTITALRAKYPNQVGTVKSVDRMDQGSVALRHWQIGAG